MMQQRGLSTPASYRSRSMESHKRMPRETPSFVLFVCFCFCLEITAFLDLTVSEILLK